MSTVQQLSSPFDLERLREMLDEAEMERTRLNRRIRRLRNVIRAVEAGDELPDLQELVGLAPTAPGPRAVPDALPPRVIPARASDPFATHLGSAMPPGVASPMPMAPAAQMPTMPSVDVGMLGRMTPEQLDGLPFGVVTLDAGGRIIGYSDTESRMAGLPKERVVGRNFFSEVAPCSRVKEFEGRFRDFAEGRSRLALEQFEFVFHFSHGAQRVLILISPARYRGQFHVSMIRR